jgi:hypothetical protein
MTAVEAILREMLSATEPSKDALEEAEARRDAVFEAARTYEGVYKTIKSGSIAHGTAGGIGGIISDADGSVVISRRLYPEYGPDGDGVGPKGLIEDIADDLRNLVSQLYPNVWVSTNHKHAIYFRFRDEVDGQNPTVDLVVALNRKDGGLWIPHMFRDIWQPSDPETHTLLVKAKREETKGVSTEVVRIAKLYAKQWDPTLLFSFHVTALVLEDLTVGRSLDEGFASLLDYAARTLKYGNTKDPAGVSESLKIPTGRDREKLVRKLAIAAEHMNRAIELDSANDENFDDIVEEMKKVFWRSGERELFEAAAEKAKLDRYIERANSTVATYGASASTVMAASVARPVVSTRAFGNMASTAGAMRALPITCDWYADSKERSWFEQGVHASEYPMLYAGLNSDGTCAYLVSIPVRAYKTAVLVRVVLRGKKAAVYAPGLADFGLRHVYSTQPEPELCLWYPSDPDHRRWTFDKGLLALLDITKVHLYKEYRFKETGVWPGDEVHPDDRSR